jgi:hypothetical protein
VRESRTPGSERGGRGNPVPYRDCLCRMRHKHVWTKPLSRQSSLPSSRHCPDLGHPRDFTTVVGDGSEKQGQGSALDPPKADGLWKPFIFDHRDPALTL